MNKLLMALAAACLTLVWPPQAVAGPSSAALERAADRSADLAGRAVLVQQGGVVIFEQYDRGWSAEEPHPLASGTKSFSGVLAMLAVQDGLLSLDERASDTLTEWQADPLRARITVRQLLTMSSGLDSDDQPFGGRGHSVMLGGGRRAAATPAVRPDDWFATALEVPMTGRPGAQFDYGGSHLYAFGALLERKLEASDGPDHTVMAYLQHRIFDALGISVGRVGQDAMGHPNLPGGVRLTAREWAKFGQFVLDEGAVHPVDGETLQLLRPELLAECFRPSEVNPRYGLTWWLLSGRNDAAAADHVPARASREGRAPGLTGADGERLTVWMAAGLGKQRLYIVPAWELVVVRFAEATAEGRGFDDVAFLGAILSGLQPPAPVSASPVDHSSAPQEVGHPRE